MGKMASAKKEITLPWIILSAGLLFSSLNLIVEVVGQLTNIYILPRPVVWYVFNITGSLLLLIGFIMMMFERMLEIGVLKRRKMEIQDIMNYLKERYYKKELSESELRKLYANMVEQLAEIEVKLKTLEKKKPKK